LAFLACLVIASTFVGFLYIWRGNQRRDDPSTIRRRLFSITLACSVSWLPTYFWATRLHQARCLRVVGLPRAVLDALFLVSTLFAGPLVYFHGNGVGDRAEGRGAAGDNVSTAAPPPSWLLRLAAGDLALWRNLVAAPLAEEFVFRACMVPLLGVEFWNVVLLIPLFFGAAHLHHAADLMRHQGKSLRGALLVVGFQFLYTTVFGWLATYLFLRTGHLAAPVAAHVFCNWAGFPPFGDMLSHPRGILLALTTAAGVAVFFLALPRLTSPDRY
ncbi:hypothetical protein VOLCADRAFT_32069, partial [Volvox carteri f. nagariensis]